MEFPDLVQIARIGLDQDLPIQSTIIPSLCNGRKLTVAPTLVGDVRHPMLIGDPQMLQSPVERYILLDDLLDSQSTTRSRLDGQRRPSARVDDRSGSVL